MDGGTLVVVLVVVLVVLYVWYAKIIGRRNKDLAALSGIDAHADKHSHMILSIWNHARTFMRSLYSLTVDCI